MWLKSLFFSLLVYFILGFNIAGAVSLSVVPTSDGTQEQTIFNRGDFVYVVIKLQDAVPNSVAGAALTLTYPADAVNPPALGADGLPTNAVEISSFFTYQMTEKTYRSGDGGVNNNVGRILISGANINAGDGDGTPEAGEGGAPTHGVTEPLFTFVFSVRADAPAGNYNFTLEQTTLNNPDAGWNGEAVPILVGAKGFGESGFDDLDCTDNPTTCAFPLLLSSFSPTPTGEIDIPEGDGDMDNDGLPDAVETNTGTFVDSSNTGTDPNNPDTDGDGWTDGEEISNPTYQGDPTDPNSIPAFNPSDFNLTGNVDFFDFNLFAANWLKTEDDSDWDGKYNLFHTENGKQIIDFFDFNLFAASWLAEDN